MASRHACNALRLEYHLVHARDLRYRLIDHLLRRYAQTPPRTTGALIVLPLPILTNDNYRQQHNGHALPELVIAYAAVT